MMSELMTAGRWERFGPGGGLSGLALLGLLAFSGPLPAATGSGDALEVTSVATYTARSIETGEVVGQFLQVYGTVWMADETRAQLDLARDLPRVLSARLEVDGVQVAPCGTGGTLPRLVPTLSLSPANSGEAISPLFFLPEGTGGNLELVVGIDAGGGPVEPLARSSVTSAAGLVNRVEAARVTTLTERIEQRPDYRTLGGSRAMKTVRLQLPEGLTWVLSGGTGKIYRGKELAQDLGLEAAHDVVAARFEPQADLGSGLWELHFPALGVKLELDVTAAPR